MEKPPKQAEESIKHIDDSSSGSETDVETAPSPTPALQQAPRAPGDVNIPKWRLVILIVSLCSGLFLALLDTSIVATALYSIGDDFNTLDNISWVALSYTLTYLGCCVIFPSVGDVVGRRDAYISAFAIFFVFSLACGFASTLNQLIAFRALQGVGGAGLYSLTFVIFPEIVPPAMQKFIGTLAGIVVAVAGVMGPLLGGLLSHYASWRWCFWINAPVGILPLVSFIVAWPRADQMVHAQRRRFRELDFVGCTLMIAASVLTVFSFQQGGMGENVWATSLFIAPLVVGCVCWILLVGWEVTVSRLWEQSVAAIFPLRLLKHRVYMSAMFGTLLTGFPGFLIIYSLPLRFQVVNAQGALTAGIGMLPMLGSVAVGSMLGGLLNGKKNNCFYTLMVGTCLMVIGTGLSSTLSPSLDVEAKTYGFQVFIGLGFGLTVSTASLLALFECQIRDVAVATGIIAQVRVLGGSIGIAASTAILDVTQRRELAGIVSPAQLATLQHSAADLSPSQLGAVRTAYSNSFRQQMVVCTAVAAVCILVTLGTWQRDPLPVLERRKQQIAEEVKRQTDIAIAKAKAAAIQAAQAQAAQQAQATQQVEAKMHAKAEALP